MIFIYEVKYGVDPSLVDCVQDAATELTTLLYHSYIRSWGGVNSIAAPCSRLTLFLNKIAKWSHEKSVRHDHLRHCAELSRRMSRFFAGFYAIIDNSATFSAHLPLEQLKKSSQNPLRKSPSFCVFLRKKNWYIV